MNKTRPVFRMCIVSRSRDLKENLFRLVKQNNRIILDLNQNIQGRGVYIKKDLKVIELAQKRKMLNKALKTEIDDEFYDSLKEALSKERRDWYGKK